MKVALVILNYNGRHHLEHLLPTALGEAGRSASNCRVVVLDNRSTQDDVAWVQKHYPSVEIRLARENSYLFSYNDFAYTDDSDILVFLNNDLKLLPGFVDPLLRHFVDTDVFAVSATSRDWEDTKFTFGPIQLSQHHGWYHWQPDYARQEVSSTLFASGGFMAVDRHKFLEIGGFDRLFFPAYAEDLDLCFRAWLRGWRSIMEPASVCLHRENGSWGGGVGLRAARLQLRAALLFQWARLPMPVSTLECYTWFATETLRRIACKQVWWPVTVVRTWKEWQKIQKQFPKQSASRGEIYQLTQILKSANILPHLDEM